ncbi:MULTISPECIES: adenosine deaminase [unclassified Pseudoalteromonas]|uniref:adenosine deaminase n=1 Tax=unclassified Pseudoalteromonas TaxID=194690 RepID=UPI0020974719|nr:adenosine deaminase [Pseudoalteromonas sp. XMcav2-N]MCO7191051.1 adenosine deaminase [Pseudoalteromonas sp. XMcav2-N]
MKYSIIPAAALVMLSGCASIVTSDVQTIQVTTNTGKTVEVSADGNKSDTPGSIQVLRNGQDKVIRTTAAGCAAETPVQKKVAPAFFGNVILGGLLGSTTDASTGKMWDYADSVEIQCDN